MVKSLNKLLSHFRGIFVCCDFSFSSIQSRHCSFVVYRFFFCIVYPLAMCIKCKRVFSNRNETTRASQSFIKGHPADCFACLWSCHTKILLNSSEIYQLKIMIYVVMHWAESQISANCEYRVVCCGQKVFCVCVCDDERFLVGSR